MKSKSKILNKFINLTLLIVLISHLSFIHNLLKDYVLCIGTDGHVAVENIVDCESCSINLPGGSDQFSEGNSFKNKKCQDIPINRACFENDHFIPQNYSIAIATTEISKINFIYPAPKKYFHGNPDFNLIENIALKKYSTVALLN